MADQEPIDEVRGSYPSSNSYNLVFLTAGVLSVVTVIFALLLKRTYALRIVGK